MNQLWSSTVVAVSRRSPTDRAGSQVRMARDDTLLHLSFSMHPDLQHLIHLQALDNTAERLRRRIEEIPLTPTGKADRKALPEPEIVKR